MTIRLSNGKCYSTKTSIYRQCDNLNNKIIPSCSNTFGIDGWPASTPQQSNISFTNGIGKTIPPNGFKRYFYPVYLYNYNGTGNRFYKPNHLFEFISSINLKPGKKKYIINDKEYVLVQDIIGSKLKIHDVFKNI